MLSGTGDTGRSQAVTEKDKDGNSVAFSVSQGQFHGHPVSVTGSSEMTLGLFLQLNFFKLL